MNTCDTGCVTDRAYAVIDDNKLYRITFSLSLAELIAKERPEYKVIRVRFANTKRLKTGEKSRSGLYSIVSKKTDWTLRIAANKEMADYLVDDSRYLSECYILKGNLNV